MSYQYSYIPYSETGYFSKLIQDYLQQKEDLQQFYDFTPDVNGIQHAIAQRAKFPVNRFTLVNTLLHQYKNLPNAEKATANIQLLASEHTYTICTAHQPNLMTGYLYFIYKILHTIKLSTYLNAQYPDKHFVPVYYMGSEDQDLDELGVFKFRGDVYRWDGAGQEGAVGRMETTSLKTILQQVFSYFGPPGENCDELKKIVEHAYLQHTTIGEATQYLVHQLFGKYGLVVLNPDEASFKNEFLPVIQDELFHSSSFEIVNEQIRKLDENYKSQAHPRAINLFYLNTNLRERIERKGDKWVVLNTPIEWDETLLNQELSEHPERFSPNVILRPLFQETIIPNVAFIGGGAEVAYWLQLQPLFQFHKVFYPVILLRQSVEWVHKTQLDLCYKLDFKITDLFKPTLQLEQEYISKHSKEDWQTVEETRNLEILFENIAAKAKKIDTTLVPATGATLQKMKQQLATLQKKLLKAEKRKNSVQITRINKLKQELFPYNNLQERFENFLEYYLEYGASFLDLILDGIVPIGGDFLIVMEF